MLIIEHKEGDSIDKTLKKYKKKFERSGTLRQIRTRKHFTKPSVARRNVIQRAEYRDVIKAKYAS